MDDPVRVLHVDDDGAFVRMAAARLESEAERLSVETETCPTDALDRLDEGFDCLVVDHDMPVLNGIALLERVRERDSDLPVVLFTGKGSEQVASEAISAGVTDYLQKGGGGNNFTVLANRVLNAVEARRAREQVRRRAAAMDAADEGIAILDETGRYADVNEAYAAVQGTTPAALRGRHWQDTLADDEAGQVERDAMPALADGEPWSGTVDGERADGTHYRKRLSLAPLPDGGHVCVIRDVTEAERRRRRLQEYRRALEKFPDPVAVLDETGQFRFANEALTEFVGRDDATLLGEHFSVVKPSSALDPTREAFERALEAGEPVRLESMLLDADGDPVDCEDQVVPLSDERPRTVAVHHRLAP
ncbi:MAG: PAS sensor histidine kinase [uncultured archaeon A07HB70]|nr:MAG: PAS sensor histidine kinase [uncultured archaeon A07HB70]